MKTKMDGSPATGEQKAVWNLLAHMAKNGWVAWLVSGEGGDERVGSPTEAMKAIFDLEEASVAFRNGDRRHSIFLVTGNAPDEVVADWGYSAGDVDGFDAVAQGFKG